ncbi:MAG TPA: type II toxin-antitoxin system VapC family toxin [Gaiellaceae bacterium]
MTKTPDVVIDASTVMRALVDGNESALDWLGRIRADDVAGAWPELAVVEVANGLTTLVRAGRLSDVLARRTLASALDLPIRAESLTVLVSAALGVALSRGLSAYDACYVVLAETLGGPLVTADRRLAGATKNAVLISA